MILQPREHQTFHVGLKAFIADKDQLLILEDTDGLWELPGGRTEKREIRKDLKDILAREVREELGKNFHYETGPIFHAWIRKPDPTIEDVAEVYRDEDFCIFLIGFLCTFKGGEIELSPEHKGFRWVNKDEIAELKFESSYENAIKYYFQTLQK